MYASIISFRYSKELEFMIYEQKSYQVVRLHWLSTILVFWEVLRIKNSRFRVKGAHKKTVYPANNPQPHGISNNIHGRKWMYKRRVKEKASSFPMNMRFTETDAHTQEDTHTAPTTNTLWWTHRLTKTQKHIHTLTNIQTNTYKHSHKLITNSPWKT